MAGLIITGILLSAYSFLILWVCLGWRRLSIIKDHPNTPQTRVSILIPARNEALTIAGILKDLGEQDYPPGLLEIIVIDDHSEDATIQVAEGAIRDISAKTRVIRLPGSSTGKKAAIEAGINASEGELIVTTDADCRASSQWIREIAGSYENMPVEMILAPVRFEKGRRFFDWFQEFEFMSLQMTTAGSAGNGNPLMANGANLAYTRSAFNEYRGFSGNISYPSGDDMFMMLNIKGNSGGKGIRYVKSQNAVITTGLAASAGQYLNQRMRWVSKSSGYSDISLISASLLVFTTNLFMVLGLFYFLITGKAFQYLAMTYLIKTGVDLIAMIPIAGFFGRKKLLWLIPLFEWMNAFYTITIGIIGNFLPYRWKGRTIRKK